MLALPTLKEQSAYENKFTTNQDQSIANLNNNLNSFNESNLTSNIQNLANLEMTKNLTKLTMNNQTMTNQNLNNQSMNNQNIRNQNLNTQNMNNRNMNNQNLANQTVISSNKNDANNSLTNQVNGQKQNSIIPKFSNKSNMNESNKLELMEIKQSVQQAHQKNNMCLNTAIQTLKRSSSADSPISLMEMQQNSPHCHSENSSIKSSISPGTSLSSSPIHYSTGYSNVHMLRNSVLNETTNSINQSQTSTIPLTSLGGSFLSNGNGLSFFQDREKDDGRPIAIVQGKKNRHNLNDDGDEETVGTIKKFCVNSVNNNSTNNNTSNQMQQNLQLDTSSSPNQSSLNNNDFRYIMQNHSFACNLGNNLQNNLQNNLNNSLACSQTNNNTGNSNNQEQSNQQQTDNANLFSTACCGNDCKPAVAQQEYRCGQRHSNDYG